jgi:hypothetical protein
MTAGRYRTLTAAVVLVVAAIAAVVSYMHVATLAWRYGQPAFAAYLLPLSIDGMVATSSLVMLRSARAQVSAPWLARTGLVLAVTATLAANVASGAAHGWPGALLAGWPAVAFVVSAETAISMSRRHASGVAMGLDLLPARLRERLLVNPETGCWEWQGTLQPNGYGEVSWDGQKWRTHRLVYTLLVGPIPEGLHLDHAQDRGCRSRACCWPVHLEPVTQAENNARIVRANGRSPAETQAAVKAMLTEQPDITNDELAAAIGVSARTASRTRDRLNGTAKRKLATRSPASAEAAALAALAANPAMTAGDLSAAIGVSERTARRYRARLTISPAGASATAAPRPLDGATLGDAKGGD